MEERTSELVIRSGGMERHNIPVALFLLVWLTGWAFGEAFAINQLFFTDTPIFVNIFLLIWLTGWTIGGGFAMLHLFKMIGGRERITLGRGMLKIRKSFLLFSIDRSYDVFNITGLKISSPKKNAINLINAGKVEFNYGGKSVLFGSGVSKDQATEIMNRLRAHRDLSDKNFG